MHTAVLIALALLLPSAAHAQESPVPSGQTPALPAAAPTPAPLAIGEAVRLAIANNPRLAAAARDVGAAATGVRSAGALANPTVVVAPAITSVSGSSDEFVAQQPLEINGTRSARLGVARADLRGSRAQAVASLRDVVFSTKSAYYELARAREQGAVARDALSVAQEFDRIARRQVEEGVRPGIDLAQTGIEVSRAERQVTLADGQTAVASAALNTLLGRTPSAPVGPLTPLAETASVPSAPQSARQIPVPDAPDAEEASLVGRALSARSEIETEEATRERFLQEARLARAEGRPDIAPQFRIGSFTRGVQPAASGNGPGFGIGVTLPFLDYGGRRNRIRQSEQAARAQDARVAAAQDGVRQEVAQALARQRAAEAVVQAYRGGVLDQAQRLLAGSRVGFREGQTSVLSLLEAQRSYRAVQNEYLNALADAAVARAELERATGAVPPSLLPVPDAR